MNIFSSVLFLYEFQNKRFYLLLFTIYILKQPGLFYLIISDQHCYIESIKLSVSIFIASLLQMPLRLYSFFSVSLYTQALPVCRIKQLSKVEEATICLFCMLLFAIQEACPSKHVSTICHPQVISQTFEKKMSKSHWKTLSRILEEILQAVFVISCYRHVPGTLEVSHVIKMAFYIPFPN